MGEKMYKDYEEIRMWAIETAIDAVCTGRIAFIKKVMGGYEAMTVIEVAEAYYTFVVAGPREDAKNKQN